MSDFRAIPQFAGRLYQYGSSSIRSSGACGNGFCGPFKDLMDAKGP